jgi:hypothetical protein
VANGSFNGIGIILTKGRSYRSRSRGAKNMLLFPLVGLEPKLKDWAENGCLQNKIEVCRERRNIRDCSTKLVHLTSSLQSIIKGTKMMYF